MTDHHYHCVRCGKPAHCGGGIKIRVVSDDGTPVIATEAVLCESCAQIARERMDEIMEVVRR